VESNAFIKNVAEIIFLGENMEKKSFKASSMQEDKSKDDEHGKVQDIEVEPTSHFQRIGVIIGDVSKRVTTRSKLHYICGYFAFISHIEPKNILKAEEDSYWLPAIQEELNQFGHN